MNDMPDVIYVGHDLNDDQSWFEHPDTAGVYINDPVKYTRSDLVPQWQPIDTAPFDDEELIVSGVSVLDETDMYVCTAYRLSDGFYTQHMKLVNQPSHWMPLPKPPGDAQ